MYYFYKKLTLTAKLSKSGKKTLKAHFFNGKSNYCSVLIVYFGKGTFIVKKQQTEKEDCILILDVSINYSEYILINSYNANTENKQIDVLSTLFELLKEFDISQTKPLVMAEDFGLFFNSNLEVQSGNPPLNKRSLGKLFEFKETYNLCDIRGERDVRNTKSKWFTFIQKVFLRFHSKYARLYINFEYSSRICNHD